MAWGWKWIADITGPPGDAAAMARFDGIDAAIIAEASRADAAALATVNDALVSSNLSYSLVYASEKVVANAGIERGTPAYGTPARFGTSMSGGVLVGTGVCPEPLGWKMTVEVWVYATALPATNRVILSLGPDLWLGAQPGTGYAMLIPAKQTTTGIISNVNICDGAWHHLAFTLSRNSGVTRAHNFFVDGNLIGSSPALDPFPWISNLYIGGLSVAGYDWLGRMDELRVSIGELYTAPFTPPAAPLTTMTSTLLRAEFNDRSVDVAVRSYGTRPAVPAGSVTYTGPMKPTNWLTDDRWVNNA